METRRGSQPQHMRARRLGKKAIFYGRIAGALGPIAPAKAKPANLFVQAGQKVKAFRPTKRQRLAAMCAMVLLVAGLIGGSLYQTQRAAAEKAAAKAAYQKQVRVNAAAQECYKKKTAEKQQMLGKVTFDQLYDGDSCLQQN